MIKNPFALIAERVKKSGDTMSGGLKVTAGGLEVCGRVYNSGDDEGIVVKPASNNLAGLILGSNNGKRSVFYCRTAAATAPEWNYVDGNNNSSVIYHPAKSGTIALTSDLALTDLTITLNTNVLYDNNTKVYGVKFGNIAIITGILMVKGAVSRDDVLFTISGFTPTQLTYCTATKTTANKSFLMRFDANGTQAVVDETPATATANWDFFGFNIVMYHK